MNVKYIILSNSDKLAILDEDDYESFKNITFHLFDKGYPRTSMYLGGGRKNSKYKTKYLHRMILGVEDENIIIDHINNNPLDNRKDNLRIVSQHQNTMNKKLDKRNTSGYRGVTWRKDASKWKATIGYKGKIIHLGYFETKEKAAIAYNAKAKELFGEYVKLNIILEEK